MKKRDLLVILGIVLVAAVLIGVRLLPAKTAAPAPAGDSATPGPGASDEVPAGTARYSESVIARTDEYFAQNPAESYLVVTTSNNIYAPIPLNEENEFRLTQKDGSENVVHIGKNSFYMKSSNCDNQNCVDEGEVTLENRNTRLLLNFVYCLPHNLSLQLVTPDEARGMLLGLYAEQEAIMDAIEKSAAEHSELPDQAEPTEAPADGA